MFAHMDTVKKAVRIAEQVFDLQLPLNMDLLRRAYISRRNGEDRSCWYNEYDPEHLYACYTFLAKQLGGPAQIFTFIEEHLARLYPLHTREGVPLYSLGLGLSKSSHVQQSCRACKGVGYKELFDQESVSSCETCLSSGQVPKIFECTVCDDEGQVRQRRSGRVVECRICRGTKVRSHPTMKRFCPDCEGNRKIKKGVDGTQYYMICYNCGGHGAIEIQQFIGYSLRTKEMTRDALPMCA